MQNTAHRYGSIGLAIRIDGDKSVFHQMNFLGTQSTIMDLAGLHFFYHCYIEGDVNFISGMATSIYEVFYTLFYFKVILNKHKQSFFFC